MASSSYAAQDYKIGIICALGLERTAVESILDSHHAQLPIAPGDRNTYSFGRIGMHNIVVASLDLGNYGTVPASAVANDLRRSFPQVKYGFMVGIAGGMPRPFERGGDIRLGDIVVGCANGVPSVINYSEGKTTTAGFDIRSELAEPPTAIQRAIGALHSQHRQEGPTYLRHLSDLFRRNPRLDRPQVAIDYFNRPATPDLLFKPELGREKRRHGSSDCVVTRKPRFLAQPPSGIRGAKFLIPQTDGFFEYPSVHYGTVASADTLMKSSIERDRVYNLVKSQRKAEILCFETEASGMVRDWPCLVVRGICDYSDSHKNETWQNFAAATAAAYTKDLLLCIPPEVVATARSANDVIRNVPYFNNNSHSAVGRTYIQSGGTRNHQNNADTMNFYGGTGHR